MVCLALLPVFGIVQRSAAQDRIHAAFYIGETEKNLNLAGNSTRLKTKSGENMNLAGNATRLEGKDGENMNLAGNSTRLTSGSEKLLNLAGNSTRIPLPDFVKGLSIVGIGPKIDAGGGSEAVLFALLVEGNKVVKVEASETFKLTAESAAAGALSAVANLFGEDYSAIRLAPQKATISSTYPVVPFDVGSQAYGLVAPRRDVSPDGKLAELILTEVQRARKSNSLEEARAIVLFASGAESCGEKCGVEAELLTLLLEK